MYKLPDYILCKDKQYNNAIITKIDKLLSGGINLFLYGENKYKLYYIYDFLNIKYNIKNKCTVINLEDIYYIKSIYHFEIDLNNKYFKCIIELLKNITNNFSTRYIILNNFNNITLNNKKIIISLLKNSKLIFILNLQNYEIILSSYGISFNSCNLIKDEEDEEDELYLKLVDTITDNYNKNINGNKIKHIKELSVLIVNTFNLTKLMRYLLNHFIRDNKITFMRIIKLVEYYAYLQYMYIKSYYKIIYIEYIIINTYNICYL